MLRAQESNDINERIALYTEAMENESDDMRPYYNAAYLYLYQQDYTKAEEILKKAIELFPKQFRLYSALLYLYQESGDEDKELDLLYEMLSFMYGDEDIRNRILRLLEERDDERLFDFAKETLLYYPENQRAINILSEIYPFFETRAIKDVTNEDIISYELPLSENAFMILIHPSNYNESVMEMFSGTLLSQPE